MGMYILVCALGVLSYRFITGLIYELPVINGLNFSQENNTQFLSRKPNVIK